MSILIELTMFDPCGTRKLEGDDIIARLADLFNLSDDEELKQALLWLLKKYQERDIGEDEQGW